MPSHDRFLARFYRLLLALELAAYVVAGSIAYEAGWSVAAIVAGAVAVALAMRVSLVVASISLAWLTGPPRLPEHRLPVAQALGIAVGEVRALLADTCVCFPFDSIAAPADVASGEHTPVILVHGYFGNRGYFRPLLLWLRSQGIAPVFAPNCRSAFAPIERFSVELGEAIDAVAHATGRDKVILVCHSMGGLAARHYLGRNGAGRIAKLITIASPHHGTAIAPFGLGENASEMRRGSRFLEKLAAAEAAYPPECPAVSIYTPHDNLVVPHDTGLLPWARNVALPGEGHLAVLRSPRLFELLREELKA